MEKELQKRVNATAMIVYLKLVKESINWSDADVLLYRQSVKDLDIKT